MKHVVGRFALAMLAGVALLQGCIDDGSAVDDPELSSIESDISAPTGLTVTVFSTTQENLSWNAVTGAAKYIVLRGATSGSETSYTTIYTTSLAAGHLTPNTNYCWEIKAVDASNNISGVSNEVCANTGSAPAVPVPQNVTATATASTRVTVAWTAVTGATKYTIYQGASGATPTLFATTASTSYNVASLMPSTQYCYTVSATTAAGTSVQSSPPACTTTFANGLEAYWKFDEKTGTTAADSSGFGRNFTLSGASFASSAKPPIADDLSYGSVTATGTSVMTTPNVDAFRFKSIDFSIVGWVNPGASTSFNILGMKPTGCGANGWLLAQDATNKLAFKGELSTLSFGQNLPASTWTHVGVTLSGTTMKLYINGVQVATGTYNKANHLTAEPLTVGHPGGCAGGAFTLDEFQVYSRALTATEVANFGTIPPAPTGLVAAVTSSTREDLTWNAVTGATKYLVYRGTTSGGETFITSNPTTTYPNGHLAPATTYYWQIRAVARNLISNPTTEVSATTLAGPAAPTGLTATVPTGTTGQTRINLAWTAVTGATKYYVYQSTDNVTFTFKGTSTTTSFGATGLTTMTTYYYYVVAEDAGLSQSAHSATVSAKTN